MNMRIRLIIKVHGIHRIRCTLMLVNWSGVKGFGLLPSVWVKKNLSPSLSALN